MDKHLHGTVGLVCQALQLAINSRPPKDVSQEMAVLLSDLQLGKMILDPWEIADVYSQSEDEDGGNQLTESAAIRVLAIFEDNDYRTQSGNEMLQQISGDYLAGDIK